MPVQVNVWRVGKKVEPVVFTGFPDESHLEQILADDVSILDPALLVIGRQVPTDYGKFIDLLALDADANLVVIELKRNKTPRDVVAQLLDYGSWVRKLEDEDIASIFTDYLKKFYPQFVGKSLDEAFCERFGVKTMPEELNERHELVVVASELDPSTERIVSYLADEYGAAINAVFFRFFRDGDREYLSRVWLIDPGEVEQKVTTVRGEEPWNGEYYVSFGEGEHRCWDDARKYGFISAGGGQFYVQTLANLELGNRIWVNVPGRGYVGVGKVVESVAPLSDFKVKDDTGHDLPITQAKLKTPNIADPRRSDGEHEQFVRVEWTKTVSLDDAVKEKGFFGNQNIVAKPKSKKWSHTVDRLKQRWGISE